jgi:hypothetical protein
MHNLHMASKHSEAWRMQHMHTIERMQYTRYSPPTEPNPASSGGRCCGV